MGETALGQAPPRSVISDFGCRQLFEVGPFGVDARLSRSSCSDAESIRFVWLGRVSAQSCLFIICAFLEHQCPD